jgi:hypothetical protein
MYKSSLYLSLYWFIINNGFVFSSLTLGNFSSINLVFIFRCSSSFICTSLLSIHDKHKYNSLVFFENIVFGRVTWLQDTWNEVTLTRGEDRLSDSVTSVWRHRVLMKTYRTSNWRLSRCQIIQKTFDYVQHSGKGEWVCVKLKEVHWC